MKKKIRRIGKMNTKTKKEKEKKDKQRGKFKTVEHDLNTN